jgi:hypothetical protein
VYTTPHTLITHPVTFGTLAPFYLLHMFLYTLHTACTLLTHPITLFSTQLNTCHTLFTLISRSRHTPTTTYHTPFTLISRFFIQITHPSHLSHTLHTYHTFLYNFRTSPHLFAHSLHFSHTHTPFPNSHSTVHTSDAPLLNVSYSSLHTRTALPYGLILLHHMSLQNCHSPFTLLHTSFKYNKKLYKQLVIIRFSLLLVHTVCRLCLPIHKGALSLSLSFIFLYEKYPKFRRVGVNNPSFMRITPHKDTNSGNSSGCFQRIPFFW